MEEFYKEEFYKEELYKKEFYEEESRKNRGRIKEDSRGKKKKEFITKLLKSLSSFRRFVSSSSFLLPLDLA